MKEMHSKDHSKNGPLEHTTITIVCFDF